MINMEGDANRELTSLSVVEVGTWGDEPANAEPINMPAQRQPRVVMMPT